MPHTRKELANAIRFLSIDAVEQANSGHPGMPMGMADIAEVLWRDFLKHNPENPNFPNRDRFVLSNGHGSMLLYSLLHLSGYNASIDDLKNFRQLNSKTPGHPEFGELDGVETTTGPLGQGIANAVGMAIAEKILASQFNKPGFNIVDNYTYCFAGDGCLMEGISHEAASLAGTLGLNKLIMFWDDNNISIDGKVDNWFSENTPARFKAYNWNVLESVDGHNSEEIKQAIIKAQASKDKPTLICTKTTIGFGSPKVAGTAKSHGAPLGETEIAATRANLNWPYPAFEIPESIYSAWNAKVKGAEFEAEWNNIFTAYKNEYPELVKEFERRIKGDLPSDFSTKISEAIEKLASNVDIESGKAKLATRKASKHCLDFLGKLIPELTGGSADLSCSNLTNHETSKPISKTDFNGNYIFYGVREFGMAAIMNGLALYGGLIPYGGTFLVFSDYARNAIRLSALLNKRVIYVLTHDSIGLGEDGPTHQPVEHLAMLRLTPNLSVWRPADEVETYVAWKESLQRSSGPTVLSLTRQGVTTQPRNQEQIKNISKGGYILYSNLDSSNKKNLDLNILATGSEVEIAIDVAKELAKSGFSVQVVSLVNTLVFDKQSKEYKTQVIPENVKTVAIEAAAKDYWYKYVGKDGLIFGLDDFGKSAPYKEIYKYFQITKEDIIEKIK